MFCCDPTRCPKAQYVGVSIDFDRDERTQDLLKPPGFLFLGKLFFFGKAPLLLHFHSFKELITHIIVLSP